MGGPAAGVLLKRVLGVDEVVGLRAWLAEVAELYDTSQNRDIWEGWEFFVRWPLELGDEPPRGACLGGIQLFVIDLGAESSGEQALTPGEWVEYEKALGWMPAAELSVSIYCNQLRDHKTLAWLCAQLADRLDGMVDVGGRLPVPERKEWDSSRLDGSMVTVQRGIDTGPWSGVDIVDSLFLTTWVRHPHFHMIK
jgi:hypothetical protein